MNRAGSAYLFGLSIGTRIIGNDFIAYPNPTPGKLTIDLGQTYSGVTMTIWNLTGQLVNIKNCEMTSQPTIEFEGATAYYLIEINTAEGKSATLKVLKE